MIDYATIPAILGSLAYLALMVIVSQEISKACHQT